MVRTTYRSWYSDPGEVAFSEEIAYEELTDQPHLAFERELYRRRLIYVLEQEIACMEMHIHRFHLDEDDGQQEGRIALLEELVAARRERLRVLRGYAPVGYAESSNPSKRNDNRHLPTKQTSKKKNA